MPSNTRLNNQNKTSVTVNFFRPSSYLHSSSYHDTYFFFYNNSNILVFTGSWQSHNPPMRTVLRVLVVLVALFCASFVAAAKCDVKLPDGKFCDQCRLECSTPWSPSPHFSSSLLLLSFVSHRLLL